MATVENRDQQIRSRLKEKKTQAMEVAQGIQIAKMMAVGKIRVARMMLEIVRKAQALFLTTLNLERA